MTVSARTVGAGGSRLASSMTMDFSPTLFDKFVNFATERERIRLKRANGDPAPWTNDTILHHHHFCNMRREDDRVTVWIAQHWRNPHKDDPDLWFAMCIARFVNWPDTLEELGYPVPWRSANFLKVMRHRANKGARAYNPAYMIRSDASYKGRSKAEYQVEQQFNRWWESRKILRPKPDDSLTSYHLTLSSFYGFGSFMAAQIIADIKYVDPLLKASDWMTFAASGPGSRRGLNRLLGLSVGSTWKEDDWRLTLARVQERFNERWPWVPLHAQDIQNALCEWDKYQRAKEGAGQLRRFRPYNAVT